jgi:Flp pilus assembly pilin Flp
VQIYSIFKKLVRDENGQYTVESMVLAALLVSSLASSMYLLLPYLGEGYMGMAKAIAGPVP